MTEKPVINADLEVLREMVRLAERRRDEEFRIMERLNQYNLALIGFAGAFLSLLVTATFEPITVQLAGACLILSILFSLLSIRPRTLRGGTIVVDEDVLLFQRGEFISIQEYLLTTADLLENAANAIAGRGQEKKRTTIYSAIFLAIALLITYSIHAYA